MPEATDWATALVFQPANALDAWRGLLRGIESVDFREVPSDVVGRIFQKLIGPDERHRYGQHFTGDDPVDLINAFCIRAASDTVLDPACGSGSFLVRAYYRKRHLDARRPHLDLIGELFGCDIAALPGAPGHAEPGGPRNQRRSQLSAHRPPQLLRLRAPTSRSARFPTTPAASVPVPLPALDAVVGNPPYVRQEKVEKKDKARFGQICSDAWPGLRLTGRSDLHCYFWPAAARLLKPDGYFGFLTSSSWMDVEYGFALQGWMLRHFRILAVMESAAEPWFEDARVKTCVAILQRCDDEAARMANRVRFVRFARKLADIIGVVPAGQRRRCPPSGDRGPARPHPERQCRLPRPRHAHHRQGAERPLGRRCPRRRDPGRRRIGGDRRTKRRRRRGRRSGRVAESPEVAAMNGIDGEGTGEYRAGKWGRYVRAPDIYFDIMRRFGKRFVALGEIATIRFGVKSGLRCLLHAARTSRPTCLARYETDRAFREHAGGAPRKDVESGKLRIIEAGDGSRASRRGQVSGPGSPQLMKDGSAGCPGGWTWTGLSCWWVSRWTSSRRNRLGSGDICATE